MLRQLVFLCLGYIHFLDKLKFLTKLSVDVSDPVFITLRVLDGILIEVKLFLLDLLLILLPFLPDLEEAIALTKFLSL